mgnify:CR=1 FL=1|tara:strand:- start:628 stop:1305 length:678 start_codon:yes stop_codon:yes gene_type:complete
MIDNTISLSHVLNNKTPLYGGASDIKIKKKSSIKSGDTANSLSLNFPNHTGTHIDVPYHFFNDGKKLTDYNNPSQWIFSHPICIDVPSQDGYLVSFQDVKGKIKKESDLLMIRTGYEKFRNKKKYWMKNPGLSSNLAEGLRKNYPNIRAIGVDLISITSFIHREEGRKAHREFLGSHYTNSSPIILIEDMALNNYNDGIDKVFIVPLFISDADGAPCTAFGLKDQ